MQLSFSAIQVVKRVPLTISRGTVNQSQVFWLRLEADNIEGWGEATPFSVGSHQQTFNAIEEDLRTVCQELQQFHPLQRQAIESHLQSLSISSAAQAAVDTALLDWLGKRSGLPLWQLLGLECNSMAVTSVTIGISSPVKAQARLQDWLQQVQARAIKVKLGSPDGITADRDMLSAILQVLPPHIQVSVDANGGWNLPDAIAMAKWLAERKVVYLEQPLPVLADSDLKYLAEVSPLPIFVDESCFNSQDIPRLAAAIDGINIKLMKCGGLTEALRMIHTAQAHNLQVMFGCYSNTSLANTAMTHLAPLAQHLDLDSHLNLKNDPFLGAELVKGALLPPNRPGLGISHHAL